MLDKIRSPVPPFTFQEAIEKVKKAEDAWNQKNPELIANAYTVDSRWRNRSDFINGREQIIDFLISKWKKEIEYKLIKEIWAYDDNKISVRFAYEWRDIHNNWFRSYGNENWLFDEDGYMAIRHASINDLPILKSERMFNWVSGNIRPVDHPGLTELGL